MMTLLKHLEKEGKLNFISCLIKAELDKLERDFAGQYEQSASSSTNEIYILEKTKELLGYDYEQDSKREDYCLKATQVEIWQYWMSEILPKL